MSHRQVAAILPSRQSILTTKRASNLRYPLACKHRASAEDERPLSLVAASTWSVRALQIGDRIEPMRDARDPFLLENAEHFVEILVDVRTLVERRARRVAGDPA